MKSGLSLEMGSMETGSILLKLLFEIRLELIYFGIRLAFVFKKLGQEIVSNY